MIIILHVENSGEWGDNVRKALRTLSIRGKEQPVRVLHRRSAQGGWDVLNAADREMAPLAANGQKVDAVILDLMMEGGSQQSWVTTVAELATRVTAVRIQELSIADLAAELPTEELEAIDARGSVLALGRAAARKGAKVIILTNAERFLKEGSLDTQAQQRIVMAVCGASAYIVKTDDDWDGRLRNELAGLLGNRFFAFPGWPFHTWRDKFLRM